MRSLDRPSRVVAHFSVDFDTDQKTLLDRDGFIKALESALEDRTRSLLEGLRQRQNQQRQSEETAASVKLNLIAESDGTCGVRKRSPDVLSESTGECYEESCLLTEQYLLSHIEFVAPGSVFVDLTSVSILSALLSPFPADSNTFHDVGIEPFEGGGKWCTSALNSCCSSDHESACILESHCPLQALAASKSEWWDRPLWAWTWLEIIMAHCAMIAQDMLETLQLDPTCTFCNVSVSTDKFLVQLPCMHRQRFKSCCRETQGGMPILIDPEVDADVICRVVDEERGRSGGGTDQEATAALFQKLLERYCYNQDSLVSEDCMVEINDLIRSSQTDVIQTSTRRIVSSGTLHVRAGMHEADIDSDYVKTINEVQNESPIVMVTPEAKRCAKAIADVGCDTSDKCLKNPPERQRSPQIDSRGIDVTMLSQLPASVRSEARIAVALRNNISTARGQKKPNARACLQNWFPRISNQCADKENNNIVIGVVKERKTGWLSTSDIDPDTLRELPEDIQEMIKNELSQGINSSRKRGIDSFFQSIRKRHKGTPRPSIG